MKKFFREKSLKVSSFWLNHEINDWYIIVYENDTFLISLQEVSLKYHKMDRSIIKTVIEDIEHHKIVIEASQNRHKASCIKSKPPNRTKCPKSTGNFGHSMPAIRASSAHHLFCRCPTLGPWVTTWWAQTDRLMVSDRPSCVLTFPDFSRHFFTL